MLADSGILGSKTSAGSGIAAEFDRGPLLALRAYKSPFNNCDNLYKGPIWADLGDRKARTASRLGGLEPHTRAER
jgi:hypothetical protein